MWLLSDFGITRDLNKAKKKAWEILNGSTKKPAIMSKSSIAKQYKEVTKDLPKKDKPLKKDYTSKVITRLEKADVEDGLEKQYLSRSNKGRDYILRKGKSNEYVERGSKIPEKAPDKTNYTDIRKTKDSAASDTGYLGFHKDIYHPNYMVEGSVPIVATGKKIRVKPRIEY